MKEEISTSMNQISELLKMTDNQFSIVKLILEKTYLQGMKEGSIRTYKMFTTIK